MSSIAGAAVVSPRGIDVFTTLWLGDDDQSWLSWSARKNPKDAPPGVYSSPFVFRNSNRS